MPAKPAKHVLQDVSNDRPEETVKEAVLMGVQEAIQQLKDQFELQPIESNVYESDDFQAMKSNITSHFNAQNAAN
jgi:hypothetical protein